MITNQGFQKATALLSHPLSMAAILILIINDHWLRQVWPSWLTGKLGDFAWLFFVPYALAAVLSLVIPKHWSNQIRITGLLAFGLTGLIFSLTKTVPEFHDAVVRLTSQAVGFQVGWQRDPSDLIALAALAGAGFLWMHSTRRNWLQARGRTSQRWWLIGAAVLLTVANSAMPETGVGCVEVVDEGVLACSSYDCYISQDWGMRWTEIGEDGQQYCSTWQDSALKEQVLVDPTNPVVQYRYTPGISIERSKDNGQTWAEEYWLRPLSQPEQAYAFRTSNGNANVYDPPLGAIFDPASGNLIFAMGFSGVLVRQEDGSYKEVGVGRFTPEKPDFGTALISVLAGEMILALIFGGLGIATLSMPDKKHWLRLTAIVLGWIAWGATGLVFSPAISQGAYAYLFTNTGLLVAGVLALVLAVETLIRNGVHAGKQALRLGVFMIGSAILFFLPFLGWLVNFIPMYILAWGLGTLFGGGLMTLLRKTAVVE